MHKASLIKQRFPDIFLKHFPLFPMQEVRCDANERQLFSVSERPSLDKGQRHASFSKCKGNRLFSFEWEGTGCVQKAVTCLGIDSGLCVPSSWSGFPSLNAPKWDLERLLPLPPKETAPPVSHTEEWIHARAQGVSLLSTDGRHVACSVSSHLQFLKGAATVA